MTTVEIDVPLRLWSESNSRDAHWRTRHARRKQQRTTVAWAMRLLMPPEPLQPPFVVHLVRCCPKRNFAKDEDNRSSCFKAVRDEVAEMLGVDDADLADTSPISWTYEQRVSPRHSVLIRISTQEAT